MAFIAGYIATLQIDGKVIHTYSSDASLSLTNETLDKTTLGLPNRNYIPGLQDGNISIQMHLDTNGIVDVQAAYAATTPVTFIFRPGALGTNDAGQWSGTFIISTLDVSGNVDDNWQMNIDGQITGAVSFTQPV